MTDDWLTSTKMADRGEIHRVVKTGRLVKLVAAYKTDECIIWMVCDAVTAEWFDVREDHLTIRIYNEMEVLAWASDE